MRLVVAVPILVGGLLLGQLWLFGPLPGDGRLLAREDATISLGAPPREVWTATVGADLCTTGDPVTIDDVAAASDGDVREVTFQVLTMRSEDRREAGSGGYGTAAGTPPDFTEPYADADPLPGRYEPAIGAEVTAPCGSGAEGAVEQTLLIVPTVGPAGGAITDVRVTHRSWGRGRPARGEIGLIEVCGVDQRTALCRGVTP